MRYIDEHAEFDHLLHNLLAEVGESERQVALDGKVDLQPGNTMRFQSKVVMAAFLS